MENNDLTSVACTANDKHHAPISANQYLDIDVFGKYLELKSIATRQSRVCTGNSDSANNSVAGPDAGAALTRLDRRSVSRSRAACGRLEPLAATGRRCGWLSCTGHVHLTWLVFALLRRRRPTDRPQPTCINHCTLAADQPSTNLLEGRLPPHPSACHQHTIRPSHPIPSANQAWGWGGGLTDHKGNATVRAPPAVRLEVNPSSTPPPMI
jgi:hypothetical protein